MASQALWSGLRYFWQMRCNLFLSQSAVLLALLGSAAFCLVQARERGPMASAAHAWTFDPQVLLARSGQIMRNAPDPAIDRLFQAVWQSAQQPQELRVMCAFFQPGARRDLASVNRAALRFSAPSQRRFQEATDSLLQIAEHAPPQPYDAALAQHALTQAAVTAAMLHDGFVAGLNTSGADVASREARCRSLRLLLGTVSMRSQSERAMIMRLLMREGMARLEH